MKHLTSYNSIKNIAFSLLTLVIVFSVAYTILLTNNVFRDAFINTRIHYNDLVRFHKMENDLARAYELFIKNINRKIVTPDEILVPISSMIRKNEIVLDSISDKNLRQRLNNTLSALHSLKAGFTAMQKIKNDPSHSDTLESLQKSVDTTVDKLMSEMSSISKTASGMNIHGTVMENIYALTDLKENLQLYYTQEPMDFKGESLIINNILQSLDSITGHDDHAEEFIQIRKSLNKILINTKRVYEHRTVRTDEPYIEEETEIINSEWKKCVSALYTLREHESEYVSEIETEVYEKWKRTRLIYIYSAVSGVILIILSALFLSSVMNQRLKKQLEAIQGFAEGELDTRINSVHNDYLGKISMAFDSMADIIQEKDREIHKTLDDLYNTNAALETYKGTLETRVLERTRELSETAQKLRKEIDIRKHKEQELLLFQKIFDFSSEAIIVTDTKGEILSVNPAFQKVTGFSAYEVVGQKTSVLKSGSHNENFYKRMWEQVNEQKEWSGEIWNKKKDGTLYPAYLSIYGILNRQGETEYLVGIQRDITDLKSVQEELRKQAFYDSLTGLPNRALCFDRLNVAINMAKRTKEKIAVMFLDLDKFKNINDTLGHDAGDLLLKQAARRLTECARESDTVCRLGGDEFVIILNNAGDERDIRIVADRIIDQMSQPFNVSGSTINTSTSLGITVFPDDGADYEKLMKNADIAMYKAKSTKRGTYEFYTSEMEKDINEKLDIEKRVSFAVHDRAFVPFFQPIIDTQTNMVTGIEVLARWVDRGLVRMPAEFINILEETGEITVMTQHILEDSLMFLKKLEIYGISNIWMSVNMSPVTLMDNMSLDNFINMINSYGFKNKKIVFEVTENILINDFSKIQPVIDKIKKNGISIALDDFGTGYSSLNYLSTLMPDKLKLDKSFVHQLSESYEHHHICSSVSNLTENMGIQLIAEGVESEHQKNVLKAMGYRYMQGFLFSKPEWEDAVIDTIFEMNKKHLS